MHIQHTLALSMVATATAAQSYNLYAREYEAHVARTNHLEAGLHVREAYDGLFAAREQQSGIQRRGLGSRLDGLINPKAETKTLTHSQLVDMGVKIKAAIDTCVNQWQNDFKTIKRAEEKGKKIIDQVLADYPADSKSKDKTWFEGLRAELDKKCGPGDRMKRKEMDEIVKYMNEQREKEKNERREKREKEKLLSSGSGESSDEKKSSSRKKSPGEVQPRDFYDYYYYGSEF